MKAKTYYQRVGKKVRLSGSRDGRVGMIADSAGIHMWWLVEWQDGKKTKTPQRQLEVLPDDDPGSAEHSATANRTRD
jgi:hypothetical protein